MINFIKTFLFLSQRFKRKLYICLKYDIKLLYTNIIIQRLKGYSP